MDEPTNAEDKKDGMEVSALFALKNKNKQKKNVYTVTEMKLAM